MISTRGSISEISIGSNHKEHITNIFNQYTFWIPLFHFLNVQVCVILFAWNQRLDFLYKTEEPE